MKNYIEDKKVMGTSVFEGEKTPGGNEMVKVMFEDGSEEIMPKLRYEMIVTEERSDASTVQQTIQQKVGAVLFGVLHEYGILMGEADEVINTAANLVNAGYEKARDIKWGFPHRYLPLNEVNKVLIENHAKQSSDGTASVGGGADPENKG